MAFPGRPERVPHREPLVADLRDGAALPANRAEAPVRDPWRSPSAPSTVAGDGCERQPEATTAPEGGTERWRLVARNIFPFAVVGTIWEIVAWMGIFPHRLFPSLEEVALSFY